MNSIKQRLLRGPLCPDLIGEAGNWVRAIGAEFNFSKKDLYRVDLCVTELITNLVNYSDPQYNGQPVEVHARIETRRAVLTLVDRASPFDPFSVPPPPIARSIDELTIGGQGIPLIREFSDARCYEYKENQNRVELIFELERLTQSRSGIAKVPRQTDRRRNAVASTFPLVCGDKTIVRDRRGSLDRRAMGFLSQSQIFRGIPYAALEALVEHFPIQHIAGEMLLLKPGDPNDAVLMLLKGRLKVYLDQPGSSDFVAIEPGGFVGEMSVIDNKPVSAYVVAEAGSQMLVIDSASFLNKLMTIPGVSRNLLSALSERMRRSNKLAIQRMRKELEMEFVQRELRYAQAIQEGLLPSEPLFPENPRLDCSGKMSTAREVGGDFYDIFSLDDRRVFFVIADVCGKGLPAALFMVRAVSALRAQTDHDGIPSDYAATLLRKLNRHLCAYNGAQQFLTAFCGIIDLEKSRLHYVNAGHNAPAIAKKSGDFGYLSEPVNPFVGMIEGLTYRAGEITLESGSSLLLYTDGVTEAEDTDGNMFGEERLLACLNAAQVRTAGELVEAVFSDVHRFAGDAQQSDDITVLAIRCFL